MENGKKKLVIEDSWCKGCGICVAFCPKEALELYRGKVRMKEDADCVLCGMCELRCPDFCLYLDNEEE